MQIDKKSSLYRQLYVALAQRPELRKASSKYVTRYVHRYLEMKQIDWNLWYEFSGTVLDVACHIPIDAIILNQMPGVESISLVDLRFPPPNTLFEKAHFVQSDATRLAFKEGVFDVVMSFSSIEHLPDRALQRQWVHEMVRVVKPGGKLLVTVDNAWSWLNRIWDRYRPPMRRLTFYELRDWVMETGQMQIEARTGGGLYYWGFRPPIRGSRTLSYLIDRVLAPLSPLFPWFGNRIGYRFSKCK